MRQRDEEPRARLWHRAARQRGYFTAAQALLDGYSYPLQHFHAQRGNWLRIDHGVYRFREFADLPAEEHDHLVRWSLWSGGRAVVSHASALGVHDLGIANPAEIHLTVPPGFRKRDPAVVLYRGRLQPDEVEEHEGFQVTTPVRAIAESAADGTDQDAIDSAVAELLDRGAATRAQLLRAAQHAGARAELMVERALHAERT
jgi:predicted transcriptional regulator of viral defense system